MVSDPEVSSATKQLIVSREEDPGLEISFSVLLFTLRKNIPDVQRTGYD